MLAGFDYTLPLHKYLIAGESISQPDYMYPPKEVVTPEGGGMTGVWSWLTGVSKCVTL